jgi:hypothetical protein
MTPEQFTYWFQGKLEGRDIMSLSSEELKSIHDHLNTVFHKITPTPIVTYKILTYPIDTKGPFDSP